MLSEFQTKILSMRPRSLRTVAVANATDCHALASLIDAHKMGFVNAILCGNFVQIKTIAAAQGLDISQFEIQDCENELSAAARAVSLVRDGQADILMKGQIHTADILRAVLNRDSGIRGPGILSHVSVMYSPALNRQLFLTDMAMVIKPDIEKKVGLIKNAVYVARRMGLDTPRVAPLCAVETLNPSMTATLDADVLHKMNLSGEIPDCIVSGPIAFDVAVSPSAASDKSADGPIMGNADILLFDNIEAGNNTVKAMVHFGGWIFGGLVVGASAPIIINSRSDSQMSKLFSIACACTM